MKCYVFLCVACAAVAAAPIRESFCSIAQFEQGRVTTSTNVAGTSECTLGTRSEAYAQASNAIQLAFHSDSTFFYVDAIADAHGFAHDEEDTAELGGARSILEYSFLATTRGPVRPGLVYGQGGAGVSRPYGDAGPEPTVLVKFGDVVIVDNMNGPCERTAEGCEYRDLPVSTFTLGQPFLVYIRVTADTGANRFYESAAIAGAGLSIRFAEPGPCEPWRERCDTFVGGMQLVPEPQTGLLVLAPLTYALYRARSRRPSRTAQ